MGILNESCVAVASRSWRGDYAQKDVLVQTAGIKPAETVLDLGWEGRNILDGRYDAESIFLTSDVREYRRFTFGSDEMRVWRGSVCQTAWSRQMRSLSCFHV